MLATHGSRLRGGICTGSGPVETRFGGLQPPMWAAHVPLSGSRTMLRRFSGAIRAKK